MQPLEAFGSDQIGHHPRLLKSSEALIAEIHPIDRAVQANPGSGSSVAEEGLDLDIFVETEFAPFPPVAAPFVSAERRVEIEAAV